MIINKAASIPLVQHDPFFSIWSSKEHLYDADPVHWSGNRQQMRGYLTTDGKIYSFLGDKEIHEPICQKSVNVTATATEYEFENELVKFQVRFVSPLLLDDKVLVSRPCTYVDFAVERKTAEKVSVNFALSSDIVQNTKDELIGFQSRYKEEFSYALMGRTQQQPLGQSCDKATIDWGYAYIASDEKNAKVYWDEANKKIGVSIDFSEESNSAGILLAYDDLLSVNYFGQWKKAYWTEKYATILTAMSAAFIDKAEVLEKARKLDAEIEEKAFAIGGEEYALLCDLSYRQVVAAHKLIVNDKGEFIFLSKENDSNGCIGTVDISYPSMPLFLLFDTEYVKGMLRPIFEFASRDVWEYEYAPHDVGKYPYAWGQVYGLTENFDKIWHMCNGRGVYPPLYMYPAGNNIYNEERQMPVEECGNMLIMTAMVCMLDGNADFAIPHKDVLKIWAEYLLIYGADPGNQLCTDDFAGHLSHNVNLSAKAIMGIEAYSKILCMLEEKELSQEYHAKAAQMAREWEKRAFADDHYMLAFDKPETWSLKYNLIWDKLFGSNLFSKNVYEREITYYINKANVYGTPLDSRATYTKSDWLAWCASMTDDKEQLQALLAPVAAYLENTESKVPFSDWYDTVSGKHCKFIARSVQGGIFMPMLKNLIYK